MTNLIQINTWGSLHPLVVHFPIALLFVAPLFIVLGIIVHKLLKPFYICALILMLLGTSGVFLAVSTGESATESIPPDNPAIISTLTAHTNSAERAQLNFSLLSVVFLIYVLSPIFRRSRLEKYNRVAGALFLVVYLFNLLLILNTAHYGGQLVHQHGIRSTFYADNSIK